MASVEIKVLSKRLRDREVIDRRVNEFASEIGAVLEPMYEGRLADLLDLHTVMPCGYTIVHRTLTEDDLMRMFSEKSIV